jgi:hypothetical protein
MKEQHTKEQHRESPGVPLSHAQQFYYVLTPSHKASVTHEMEMHRHVVAHTHTVNMNEAQQRYYVTPSVTHQTGMY